jgi:hypothetical protein
MDNSARGFLDHIPEPISIGFEIANKQIEHKENVDAY